MKQSCFQGATPSASMEMVDGKDETSAMAWISYPFPTPDRYTRNMMSDEEPTRNRYRVVGNVEAQYVDEDERVLVNKCGITDLETLERAEEECLARAYERLVGQVRVDTLMTSELLLHIHKTIFDDLYEWAGRWRTVRISKPGVLWPPPDYLDRSMREYERDVLAIYPPDALVEEEPFCRALGHLQGEFLAIHPFREGNARTIKLLSDLLSLQTGRPLLTYDQSERGREQYIDAASAALTKNYEPMTDIIRGALGTSQQSP